MFKAAGILLLLVPALAEAQRVAAQPGDTVRALTMRGWQKGVIEFTTPSDITLAQPRTFVRLSREEILEFELQRGTRPANRGPVIGGTVGFVVFGLAGAAFFAQGPVSSYGIAISASALLGAWIGAALGGHASGGRQPAWIPATPP